MVASLKQQSIRKLVVRKHLIAADGASCDPGSGGLRRDFSMKKVFAIVILAAGILALAYGGFGASQRTQEANVGPLEITVALAIVGGGFLTRGSKQRSDGGPERPRR
jgi:hypothetical protein